MKTFTPADILLPADGIEYMKWSVVACDQYTSDANYWKETEKLVGGAPSTLTMTLPEIYLEDKDVKKRIKNINLTICKNLSEGKFKFLPNTFVYVERTLKNGSVRKGLVGKLDLEDYSFKVGSKALIRATEGTVIERIPPRVKIRENAPVEFPHIMVLIDDPEKTVIEPLEKNSVDFPVLYDFDLMNYSGKIKGYAVNHRSTEEINEALDKLADKKTFNKKYGLKNRAPLVFAMGDGNHSLATAKTCWDKIKKKLTAEERENHPARYALVEIVNLHDDSLNFEPIHRAVFGADIKKITASLAAFFTDIKIDTKKPKKEEGVQVIEMLTKGGNQYISIKNAPSNLAVGSLQAFLDDFLSKEKGKVDYIHGEEEVERLVKEEDAVGFLLPPMRKDELFKTIILDGVLPRKTFSMGHAEDKRFYLEGRRITR